MSENADTQTAVRATQGRIVALLDDLSPESLTLVERFVQFLRDQARRGQPVVSASVREGCPPYVYPTVPVPPSSLDACGHKCAPDQVEPSSKWRFSKTCQVLTYIALKLET